MIGLTGKDETDLRELWEHLDVKPPLVGLLRQAVREFLVRRLDDRSGYRFTRHKEWAAKFRRKYPPFRIVPRQSETWAEKMKRQSHLSRVPDGGSDAG